jgi:hypothetical protein
MFCGFLTLHGVIAYCGVLHYISYGLQHQRNTGKGDQMGTKKEAKARKNAWNVALAEGRVVRTNDGNTLTAYATVEGARRAVETNLKVGLVAEIVEIKF